MRCARGIYVAFLIETLAFDLIALSYKLLTAMGVV